MKGELAAALLSNVMDWNQEDLASERLYIEMMAELKYDEYQQYSQGMRFVESLAQWLNNIDAQDRQELYLFIKNNLIYFSPVEIRQLIDVAFSFYVKPILIQNTKKICDQASIKEVKKRKDIYKCCRRQTLFLGLSDGSHIDIFRRDHSFLSNEQIHVHYDFSKKKIAQIIDDLRVDLKQYNELSAVIGNQFRDIILLDDFSASGISFIRKEGETWKGKIPKFFDQLDSYEFDYGNINFHVLLYAATGDAIKNIRDSLGIFIEEKERDIEFSVSAIQLIDKVSLNNEINAVLKKYYDKYNMREIETDHYRKGKANSPYLGFNECSLGLVLYHNTPNNSLPIIWFDKEPFKGLFPRVSRHKEEV